MPFIIVIMLVSLVVAVFAIQNAVIVPVNFFFLRQEASLVLVILGSAFLGLLLGSSAVMYVKFRKFWEGRKKNEQIKQLAEEKELLEKKVAELEKELVEAKNKKTAEQAAAKS